jgi:hypothetical protein
MQLEERSDVIGLGAALDVMVTMVLERTASGRAAAAMVLEKM